MPSTHSLPQPCGDEPLFLLGIDALSYCSCGKGKRSVLSISPLLLLLLVKDMRKILFCLETELRDGECLRRN